MGIQTPTYEPQEDLIMAEGYAEAAEGHENLQHQHRMTAELPIVRQREYNLAAETGLVAIVNLGAEGKDNDEAQDASLTGGETTPTIYLTDAPSMPLMTSHKVSLTDDTPTTDESATIGDMMTPLSEPQKNVSATTQKMVLLAEDDETLAEVIVTMLERMNMKVIHVTHGDKAVARFSELNFDMILLDITLPDTTGWKIMDAIKERLDATNGSMPKVIVITALDDPANRLIGKLQGVHNYLIKPFSADEIETIVMKALDISPAS